MKVMTKTELKKQTTKNVLDHLVKEYNAYNIDREAQYFEFWVDYNDFTLQMQIDTRGYDVSSWDSVKLTGNGWSQEEIDKNKYAVELEDKINKSIEMLLQ